MIDNEIRQILSRRIALHPEDSLAAEECWKEEIMVLSRDIEETIDFFSNRCTGEEFAWLSKVFEDVLEKTHSKELSSCLCAVARKYPEETQEYNILSFITNDE